MPRKEYFSDRFTLRELYNNPQQAPLPEKVSELFWVSDLIISITDESNLSQVLQYLQRLDLIAQIMALRGILKKKQNLILDPAFLAWVKAHANNSEHFPE